MGMMKMNGMMPSVSVIVTVYNGEKYIKACLDSLLEQTLQNFELLIIDDASTDRSAVICKQIEETDSRVKYIGMNENSGVGRARNRGLQEAKGRFITFVDGDDTVKPEYLKILYQQAILYHADVIAGGSEVYKLNDRGEYSREEDNVVASSIRILPENPVKRIETMLDNGTSVNAWGKMYRREFIEKNKLHFDDMTNFEDCLFNFICLYYAEKYVFTSAANYRYYIRNSSLSRGFELARVKQYWTSGIKILLATEKWMQGMEMFCQNAELKFRVKLYFFAIFFHWHMLPLGNRYAMENINHEVRETCKEYFNEQQDFVILLLDYCILQQNELDKEK